MITLQITTHSGLDDLVQVEAYDPKELETRLNNNDIHSIALGENVYSRIDLKNIKLITA